MASTLVVIGIVIFMIINLIIYHKIFNVLYFDFQKGCFMELFFAWFAAMLEMGAIVWLGKTVLGGIVKIIPIIVVIILIVLIGSKIVQLINENKDPENNDTKNADNVVNDFRQSNSEMGEKKESDGTPMDGKQIAGNMNINEMEKKVDIEKQNNIRMIVCGNCGKTINENVKFCNFCGTKMVKNDMNACTKCGSPITPDANFCDCCGEKIREVK